MDSPGSLALVLGIIFLSTFTRSALGFGDALIAMPLLTAIVGLQVATPLVALCASTIAITILLRAWRRVEFGTAWRLVVSSLVGIPLGLLFLKQAPEPVVKGTLGAVLVLFGLYNLIVPRLPTLRDRRLSYAFGIAAGILGGAYNTNGPPVVIYGVLRGWSPESFRATLQSYFLPTGLAILISHGLAGLWTPVVLRLYLFALPMVLAAVTLGGRVNRMVRGEQFKRIVYALLIVMGVLLFV